MQHQQNVGERALAVVVLLARDTTYADLLPLVPEAEKAFRRATAGVVLVVEA